jgi:hypothetical protein
MREPCQGLRGRTPGLASRYPLEAPPGSASSPHFSAAGEVPQAERVWASAAGLPVRLAMRGHPSLLSRAHHPHR